MIRNLQLRLNNFDACRVRLERLDKKPLNANVDTGTAPGDPVPAYHLRSNSLAARLCDTNVTLHTGLNYADRNAGEFFTCISKKSR